MHTLQAEQRSGINYLETVTSLLQRIRAADPIKGTYEAADLQWWWRSSRPTDDLGQLFWTDNTGQPAAAVIITEWSDRVAMDPMFLPDAGTDLMIEVVERGVAHAREAGFKAVELEVSQQDDELREVLLARGFSIADEGIIAEAWLDVNDRPEVSSLRDGYRLTSRAETMDRPHHNKLSSPEMSERLLQTSLYRTDLDLLVVDINDEPAGFGVFWFDPVTATGLVEPMRTEEDHQQRGLARHILTAGVDLLARAGAERIAIAYEPDNPASGHLYRSVGFTPVKLNDAFAMTLGTADTPVD